MIWIVSEKQIIFSILLFWTGRFIIIIIIITILKQCSQRTNVLFHSGIILEKIFRLKKKEKIK